MLTSSEIDQNILKRIRMEKITIRKKVTKVSYFLELNKYSLPYDNIEKIKSIELIFIDNKFKSINYDLSSLSIRIRMMVAGVIEEKITEIEKELMNKDNNEIN